MKRLIALAAVGLVMGAGAAHAADDPATAPSTTTSADGRTVTDGTRSLAVSAVRGLNPDGEKLTVEGAGYDASKGIYVSFCVIPPANQSPTPCGGGQDRGGGSGESAWISSNPPVYATGLTTPYGPNGSFRVRLSVKAALNADVDCRTARCAVTTRNDHTRSSDRSQDIFVPLTFTSAASTTTNPGGAAAATTLPPATIPPTTTTTRNPALGPPLTTISADALSVSGGGKTLSASSVRDLTPGQRVFVRGHGFDPMKGVYVAVCAIPTAGAPGPCGSGSDGTSAWISSNPPDFGKERAAAYGAGGAFEASLVVDPVIDNAHDCRLVACAITTRNDDNNATDRSQDLLLPVAFGAASPTTTSAVAITATNASADGAPVGALVGGLVALVVASGAFVFMRRRTRQSS